MRAVLLDTHIWSWTLLDQRKLSLPMRDAIDTARIRYLSPISFYEVAQKVRLGKWPEMASHAERLRELAHAQGLVLAKLDGDICFAAGALDWSHRDPFDRLIAATARLYRVPLVSADSAFDEVVDRIA